MKVMIVHRSNAAVLFRVADDRSELAIEHKAWCALPVKPACEAPFDQRFDIRGCRRVSCLLGNIHQLRKRAQCLAGPVGAMPHATKHRGRSPNVAGQQAFKPLCSGVVR